VATNLMILSENHITEYHTLRSWGVPFAFRRWYGHGSNFD